MAARGGGRGGRGGWRGRGRGGGGGGPVARDDEGNIVAVDVGGPPPLYPDGVRLPERPVPTAKDERLMSRRHALLDFYRAPHSPYHLNAPKKKAEGVDQAVERYGDRYKQGSQLKRPQLSKVLYLHPKYFPSELYSSQQQRLSARNQAADAQAAFFKDQGSKQGVSRLEQLAKMESKLKDDGEAAETDKKVGKGQAEEGEQDDDEMVEEFEEEDDFIEDDDYYQGNHFDDDEGYDDPYDDGDDGPIF